LQYSYVKARTQSHHGEDPLVDRVVCGSVSSRKILASQQTSFGTSRLIGRSGQLYDTQLVPEIDVDNNNNNYFCQIKLTVIDDARINGARRK